MTYVIGDVHGFYDTMVDLTRQLPADSRIIFVGDLIDRGPDSAKVVQYVREKRYECVKGNHEYLMTSYGHEVIKSIVAKQKFIEIDPDWKENGAIPTLRSYGLTRGRDEYGNLVVASDAIRHIDRFIDDMRWMQNLALYIELDQNDKAGRPIVISHASVARSWDLRHSGIESSMRLFEDDALWNREAPPQDSGIFNIFGHTPQCDAPRVAQNHVNVDGGIYSNRENFGKLVAYCVECENPE